MKLFSDLINPKDRTSILRWSEKIKNHLAPPVVLLVGGSGSARQEMGMLLAKAHVCQVPNGPCGVCDKCNRVETGNSEIVTLVRAEESSIKIELVRDVLYFSHLSTQHGKKVIFFPTAEALTVAAQNVLLKALEESSRSTYFILSVAAINKILPTVRSRSQVVRISSYNEAEPTEIEKSAESIWASWAQSDLEQLKNFAKDGLGTRAEAIMAVETWLKCLQKDWKTEVEAKLRNTTRETNCGLRFDVLRVLRKNLSDNLDVQLSFEHALRTWR